VSWRCLPSLPTAQPPPQPPHRGETNRTRERRGPFPRRLRPAAPPTWPPHGRAAAGWGPRRRRRGPDAGGPAAPRRRGSRSTRPRRRQGERFFFCLPVRPRWRVVPAARSGCAGLPDLSAPPPPTRFVHPASCLVVPSFDPSVDLHLAAARV